MRAAVYARVSTKEQAEGKASIPDQIEVCERAVREHKWQYHQAFTDSGISGHLTEERTGLQSLLRDAREVLAWPTHQALPKMAAKTRANTLAARTPFG